MSFAPEDQRATLLGRAFRPGIGPSVVTVRDGAVIDITSKAYPTVRDVTEADDPVAVVRGAKGEAIGDVGTLTAQTAATRTADAPYLLAPVDLHAVKASGVTFVASLMERVIEEQARGDLSKAAALRSEITGLIGTDLSRLKPGSEQAMALKEALIAKKAWSQYLEVGIGPDAEIFTKAQPMSAVGPGAYVGLHPVSSWNNPEPEIVIVIASTGRIVGATLGNDVNLRDVEGRSALLLGKAKDNNASAALGPFIRLYDESFGAADVAAAEVSLTVTGEDGFELSGRSSMRQISRSPEELAGATIGSHHQYPDGLVLYLGTMFAPVEDRDAPGQGFTHHPGDVVTIATETLGALSNTVTYSTEAPPWTFGMRELMANLAGRGLL
ncbi:fumarylacetoacetate hydrolase [Acuticoccus sediminis]|uniref:Fumarylacetoacetate hydrolase n=1 Tax=Acuticoccus sediminis TaxID=2184697 RepID=A0A8B2NJY0_9HYPH|nr:fumarylacetoacetate hydrolase family protein [Acuticoccus sediminis]RAH99934.1 fumarylacetoacetate hydrolase [Acuticoccus sediminis]